MYYFTHIRSLLPPEYLQICMHSSPEMYCIQFSEKCYEKGSLFFQCLKIAFLNINNALSHRLYADLLNSLIYM